MKAILDPYVFFLPATPSKKSIEEFIANMDFVIAAIKYGLDVSVTKAVWTRINKEYLRFAAAHIESRILNARVQALNKLLTFTDAPPAQGETWGVKSQYFFLALQDASFWLSELANIAVYWIEKGEEFFFLTRLMVGRNVREHRTANCLIWEKTHWQIFVKSNSGGTSPFAIPCITSLRNLSVPWTRRCDDRLPDTAPTNGLAFVPVTDWQKASVEVIRTIQSKPTWRDIDDNGWSDTNTPGMAYHWDVFLRSDALKNKFGGSHVNIKSWGNDDRGRLPGEVHH